MKQLLFFLFAFVALAVNGQDLSRSYGLDRDEFFPYYAGVAKDTVGVTQDTLEIKWFANKNKDLLYNWQAKVTETRGRGLVTVSLQGRVFSTDAWTNITSIVYYGGGTDTTVNFTQHTIANVVPYNHFRLYFTKANTLGAVKINYVTGNLKYN